MKQLLKGNLSSTPLAYDELDTILIEMEGSSTPAHRVIPTRDVDGRSLSHRRDC